MYLGCKFSTWHPPTHVGEATSQSLSHPCFFLSLIPPPHYSLFQNPGEISLGEEQQQQEPSTPAVLTWTLHCAAHPPYTFLPWPDAPAAAGDTLSFPGVDRWSPKSRSCVCLSGAGQGTCISIQGSLQPALPQPQAEPFCLCSSKPRLSPWRIIPGMDEVE